MQKHTVEIVRDPADVIPAPHAISGERNAETHLRNSPVTPPPSFLRRQEPIHQQE